VPQLLSVRQHERAEMNTKHSSPDLPFGVRVRLWFSRHPEVYIGVAVGLLGSVLLLLLIRLESERLAVWIIKMMFKFLEFLIQTFGSLISIG